jgi:thioredoxin reductase (NADPH)
MQQTKCLIIGSGPAGYTAALYAGRANLQPVEYCGLQPGGQLTTTTIVENFPGYPDGVDANQMMMDLRQQAERFGADIRDGVVTAVDLSKKPYTVTIDDGTQIAADTIIVATGASAKYLGLPDEQKYNGQGVSACATCDGFFYRKKVVAVVGGGDTACEEATYLASLAAKVYMIVRKPYLRATDIMKKRVENNPKIVKPAPSKMPSYTLELETPMVDDEILLVRESLSIKWMSFPRIAFILLSPFSFT